MASPLFEQIYQTTLAIPYGQVMSYRDVAEAAGLSRRATRVVGWALRQLLPDTEVPWQRVVNKEGQITIINPHFSPDEQQRRLESEGVSFEERNGGWFVRGWKISRKESLPLGAHGAEDRR